MNFLIFSEFWAAQLTWVRSSLVNYVIYFPTRLNTNIKIVLRLTIYSIYLHQIPLELQEPNSKRIGWTGFGLKSSLVQSLSRAVLESQSSTAYSPYGVDLGVTSTPFQSNKITATSETPPPQVSACWRTTKASSQSEDIIFPMEEVSGRWLYIGFPIPATLDKLAPWISALPAFSPHIVLNRARCSKAHTPSNTDRHYAFNGLILVLSNRLHQLQAFPMYRRTLSNSINFT